MIPAYHEIDTSPFRASEKPPRFVTFRSQREAAAFFQQTYTHEQGLGLFYGPPLSGKSTALRHFVDRLPEDSAVAIVDIANLAAPSFLQTITQQFGVGLEASSINVMFNMVKVFAVQQTTKRHAPLLIIKNINAMNPETAHLICKLAQLKVQGQFAIKFILMSDCTLDRMLAAPGLRSINARKTGEHELEALSRAETAYYIDAKLRHAGVERPETVVSSTASDELYKKSGGRPGLIDRCVLKRLSITERPVIEAVDEREWNSESGDTPTLVITRDGQTIDTIELTKSRTLIGRSDFSDVVIDHNSISRHHAMVLRRDGRMVLADLNSTNGTFVNSKKVSVHGLRHDDVISLGNHKIKLFDPACRRREKVENATLADTATMKALTDIRRRYGRENANIEQAKLSAR